MQNNDPKLYVFLDTNVLVVPNKVKEVDGYDNFFPRHVSEFIRDQKYVGLNLRWVVPRMVCNEREYQIFADAKPVCSSAQKLPRLFESAWLSRSQDVQNQIAKLVHRDLHDHGVEVIECDTKFVDWDALCAAAGFRKPPFSPDESKEKGFKDAIVAETFLQFCAHRVEKTTDHAIFVSGDALLQQHVAHRSVGWRVKVLPDLDALTNELNFLSSDIPPELAEKLPDLAHALLMTFPRTPQISEFWDGIYREISSKHALAIASATGASSVWEMSRVLAGQVFLRKQLQRVYFKCRLHVHRIGRFWVSDAALQVLPATFFDIIGGEMQPIMSAFAGPGGNDKGPGDVLANVGPGGELVPPMPLPSGFSNRTKGVGEGQSVPSTTGHMEEFAVPPISFEITWSADYSVTKAGGVETQSINGPLLENFQRIA